MLMRYATLIHTIIYTNSHVNSHTIGFFIAGLLIKKVICLIE